MKNTNSCPKCKSNDIHRIPGGIYETGNDIPIGLFGSAKVSWYVCGNCGYTEEWIDRKEDIDKLVSKYQ